MSYLPAQTSVSLTVEQQSESLSISISSPSPWTEGSSYTITVKFQSNITCYSPHSGSWYPTINITYGNGATQTLTPQGVLTCGTAGTYGYASATWVPNNTGSVTIQASAEGITSNQITGTVQAPAIQTQFQNVAIQPSSTVAPGSSIEVVGTLETSSGQPVPNQTIQATLNGSTYTATTQSNGEFSIPLTAPSTPGTYTITLYFPGNTSAGLLPASLNIGLNIPSVGLPTLPTWAIATIAVVIVGGVIGASYILSKEK